MAAYRVRRDMPVYNVGAVHGIIRSTADTENERTRKLLGCGPLRVAAAAETNGSEWLRLCLRWGVWTLSDMRAEVVAVALGRIRLVSIICAYSAFRRASSSSPARTAENRDSRDDESDSATSRTRRAISSTITR